MSAAQPFIIVTDNAMQARRDHGNAMIVSTFDDVMSLADGATVAVIEYRVGEPLEDPVSAARALIDRGLLLEARPEVPFR
ncbi:hypothetical protein [Pararhizobium sp.]|uniref:hypothetical protein n=1 Tax=Pararhizobium sp. TaxID=1977563 RepID=UPI003D0DCAE8